MSKKINKLRQRCFFDISIGDRNVGRIVFELFNDICPKTCDNFRSLCTGEKGIGRNTQKPLHYKNAIFHRVVKNFIIQSGDFSTGNGRGGESIYGGTFEDENFTVKHEKPFLLSMANRGKNTNGSQFFITLNPAPHLDGVHVVFGHVLSGQEVIDEVHNQPIDKDCKPLTDVVISNCGELIPQIKAKDKKKKHRKDKSKKSDGEVTSDEENEETHKKKKKDKKHKRHKKSKEEVTEDVKMTDKEVEDLMAECSVRPEEVPDIPENKFLMRETKTENNGHNEDRYRRNDRNYDESGRKFKGRGVKRFRTSSEHRYRSGSETPPHWRDAQMKLVNWKDVVSGKPRFGGRENRNSSFRPYPRRDDFRRRDNYERNRYQSWNDQSFNASYRDRDRDMPSEKKRVFKEEPPSREHLRQSVSPQRDDQRTGHSRNGISFVPQINDSPELQRHSVRSEVKLMSRKESSEEPSERRETSPLDLKDIPLPESNIERSTDDRDNRNRKDSREFESHSTYRRYDNERENSPKRSSRRRRHSSDS